MTADSKLGRLFITRSLRAFTDGGVSVLLATHLASLGLDATETGVIVTSTLLGSAALTLAVGIWGSRVSQRAILLGASALMFATGFGFFAARSFLPLLIVAFVGTLNPSAGDVSVFLPAEQAALSELAGTDRIAAFARFNVCANLAGALGALASALPARLTARLGTEEADAARYGFLFYALIGAILALIYRGLPTLGHAGAARPSGQLSKSRTVVLRLSALFCVDAFGSGFAVQAMLALWLFKRFQLSVAEVGSIFFACSVLAAFSQFLSVRLAARIGLIRTMVYTHLPANACLVLAAFAPTPASAVSLLLLRMLFAQMDVPARQAYVMAVVPPEERAAAASITNVPRSLASALTPALAGMLLAKTSFGWPLVLGGGIKIAYDLLLLMQFRAQPAPGELRGAAATK